VVTDDKNLAWAHALRTIACALVVLAHINIYMRPGPENWWPGGEYLTALLSLAVPSFFLLSGYFAINMAAPRRTWSLWRYVWRKMRRLMLPFFVWGVVLIAIGVEPPADTWWLAVLSLFTGPWYLYYVFVLAQLFFLAYCVERFVRPTQLDRVLLLALLVSAASYALMDASLWLRGEAGALEMQARKAFPLWAAFFVSGIWLRWRPAALALLRRQVWPLCALAMLACAAYVWELRQEHDRFGWHPHLQFLLAGLPLQLPGALLLALGLRCAQRTATSKKLLIRLGAAAKDSLAIYLCHGLVLVVLFDAWASTTLSTVHWASVPAMAVLVWAAGAAGARTVRRLRLRPIGSLAFGMRVNARRSSGSAALPSAGQSPVARQ
jgi:fucose 4-O-acetylase-like acetyltransferase